MVMHGLSFMLALSALLQQPAEPSADATQVKIIKVEHADVRELESVLANMFSLPAISSYRDNNTILVRADEDTLVEVEAVIARLDVKPEPRPAVSGNRAGWIQTREAQALAGRGLPTPSLAGDLGIQSLAGRVAVSGMDLATVVRMAREAGMNAEKAREYQSLESEIASLAAECRQLARTVESSEQQATLEAKKSDLAEKVEAAFQLRQEIRRDEVSTLRNRLEQVEKVLSEREEQRETIVNNRVSDLLDADRDRLGGGSPRPTAVARVGSLSAPSAPLPPAATGPTTIPLPPLSPAAAPTVVSPLPELPPVAPSGEPNLPPGLGGPAAILAAGGNSGVAGGDLRFRLLQAASKRAQFMQQLDELRSRFPSDSRSAEITARLSAANQEVRAAEQQYELLLREMKTLLKLQQLEIQTIEARLTNKQQALAQAEALYKDGTMSIRELQTIRADHETLQFDLEKAQLVYSLSKDVLDEAEKVIAEASGEDSADQDKAPKPTDN